MTLLTETARAKVNLTLRVLGRRPDGYHDLESLAFADCADALTLVPVPSLVSPPAGRRAGLRRHGRQSGDPCGTVTCRRIPGLTLGQFTLDKHLPVAAGIGGGSADAAAALRLLARANNLAIDDERIVEVARETGADIPVCLASRACTMTGVGENLAMLDIPAMPCVMVNPRVGVATKDVFTALGLGKGELLAGIGDVMLSPGWPVSGASFDEWIDASHGTNDLEKPALQVEPVIGDVLQALRETDGVRLARMSGSGATCFGIFTTDARRRRATDRACLSRMVGACGRAEFNISSLRGASATTQSTASSFSAILPGRTRRPVRAPSSSARMGTAPAHRRPWRPVLRAAHRIFQRAMLGHQADGMIEVAVADLALSSVRSRMRARHHCRAGTPARQAA
jgi:4-diphosphocytidyl-2-C-methyl-D-erythritol kinase